jgi:hypothetical protein
MIMAAIHPKIKENRTSYIYIYMCVCVCECVLVTVVSFTDAAIYFLVFHRIDEGISFAITNQFIIIIVSFHH